MATQNSTVNQTSGADQASYLASSKTTTATKSKALDTSRTTIANNFDTFLQLLTTQLKNQNPLDPMDTNEFTQQLVQFASVEQQLKSNDTLSSLLSSSQAATASNAIDFVGATVTADGKSAPLSGGQASWRLSASRSTPEASITIKNADGDVVATDRKALLAGDQSYIWNGRTSTGTLAPDGEYTITVTANDATAQPITIKTEIAGIVDGVDLSGATPILTVGSARVPLSAVTSIRRPNQA